MRPSPSQNAKGFFSIFIRLHMNVGIAHDSIVEMHTICLDFTFTWHNDFLTMESEQ
jgi:hypothetical protein